MIMRRRKKHGQASRRKFLAAWLRAPLKVGAVMPSSRALARAMAAQVDMHAPGLVIELGAGTGAMTHALLEKGLNPERLLVVERDKQLHALLALLFPDLDIACADALTLPKLIADRNPERVNAIVSSLPFRSMPKNIRKAIIERLLETVAGQGCALVQFTYGARSPIPRKSLKKWGMTGKRVKTVLTNVPPAHVWLYSST